MKNTVTEQQIEDLLANSEIDVRTVFGKVTVVCCKLPNGFVITEASGAVDPTNYSEETGRDICMERITNKLWELEGYALSCKIADRKKLEKSAANAVTPFDFGNAITFVKNGLKCARKGWNGKNQHIELATGIGYVNNKGEQINPSHEAIGNNAIAFVGTSGVQIGWLASQADMLADDWIVVEE
ncbi:MAG: Gp49 family protein [Ruminococcus sp.]|nr:Gp49 family protein [Ruminococcus sp.]